MQSPWQTDFRDRKPDYDFIERSTSAPPPETSFLFGGVGKNPPIGIDSILGTGFSSDEHQLNSSFPANTNGTTQGSSLLDPTLSNRQHAPPGFSRSDFLSSTSTRTVSSPTITSRDSYDHSYDNLSSSIPRRFPDGRSFLGSLDQQSIGENLVRAHSAAPTFDGGFSVGPPPGLSRRETPLASNLSGVANNSYLESSVDRSHILQLGQRRPASTGVIGGSQNSSSSVLNTLGLGSGSGAVRPAAKTLMDLIQEDFPPEPPADASDIYGTDFQRENAYAIERPRTTSPLSSHYNGMRGDGFFYGRDRGSGSGDDNEVLDSLDRLRLGLGESPYAGGAERARPTPQYVRVDRNPSHGQGRVQGSIYAPVSSHPQSNIPQSSHTVQQLQYDQQMGAYGTHQPVQVQSHVQTQVLPSGHTVYINSPSPQQYGGYATIQYHPHSQQHHIVHQSVPNGMSRQPNEQQYISVVPVQGGSGHVQTVGPGGTYTYWQPPDGQPGGPQRVTILPPGAGGVPVAVSHMGNSSSGTSDGPHIRQQHQQRNPTTPSHGGRGREKGAGKGRRNGTTNTSGSRSSNGGSGGGGGGGEAKPQNATISLLEDFKNKKSIRDWTVYDAKEHIVEFCQDQNGSRFIQQRLEVGDSGEKEIVMEEVLPVVDTLRNDVFGNYVVQKLLDFGTDKMKEDLRDTLIGQMVELSMKMYGCRVVQKALEKLDEKDLPRLLAEFQNNVLNLIRDQNGNHVIQKCIEVMSQKAKAAREADDEASAAFFIDQIDFVVDDVLNNVTSLACHPYGCRVLQRILEYCLEPKKGMTLDKISLCHRTLLDDQYGNYVIQHVLQFGRVEDRDMILEMVVENGFLKLSRQKFASNVVEKLLKYGNGEQRKAVVREMLKVVDEHTGDFVEEGTNGTSVVLLMVRDAYANYVVQTTLDVVPESEEMTLLLKELNAHSAELKNYTFAKHIITKLNV